MSSSVLEIYGSNRNVEVLDGKLWKKPNTFTDYVNEIPIVKLYIDGEEKASMMPNNISGDWYLFGHINSLTSNPYPSGPALYINASEKEYTKQLISDGHTTKDMITEAFDFSVPIAEENTMRGILETNAKVICENYKNVPGIPMIYQIKTIDDNTTYFQVGERLNNGQNWLVPQMPNASLYAGASGHDLAHYNYAGSIANSVEATLEFTWQITNDGYYTWSFRGYRPSSDPSLTNPVYDDYAVRKATWPSKNWTNISVPLPARTIGIAGNTIKNGWDKQLSISVDPAFGLSASGTSTDINSYISSATVSEFPSFNWPHTDGINTYGGYELTTSGSSPTAQYILYQGSGSTDRDTIYGFGQHYNDGSGTYARNPPSQLSANSDSNGNNIPYGEWHKIHMPNSIILRTVNIAARNQNASRREGLLASFLFMGVIITLSGHY